MSSDTKILINIDDHAVENPPVFLLDTTSRSNGVPLKIEYHNVAMNQYHTTMTVTPTEVKIEALPELP
jgi:hypothetical protein